MSFYNDYPDHDYFPEDDGDMPDPTRDYYDQEYDGQPDEYTEWQDYMGGDEYYDNSEAQWDYEDF